MLARCLTRTPGEPPTPPAVYPPPAYIATAANPAALALALGDWCWGTSTMRLCADTIFPRFEYPLLIVAPAAQVHFSFGFTPATVTLQLLVPRVARDVQYLSRLRVDS